MREMKDSGIEWIGKIPKDWDVVKGKFVFSQRNDRGNVKSLCLLSPTQKYGVIPQDKYEELTGMKAVKLNEKTNLALLKTIHVGDFCISLRSFQGGGEYSEYEGVVSPAYQIFFPYIPSERRFFKYLFKDQTFIDKMNSFTLSLRDGKNIAFADFANSYIPMPPIEKQRQIADFLDQKCSEIDALTADIQKQIETLEEYKKSVITEAVTKGLDPNVETKDSGVEWIGKIPEDWCVIPVKFCFSITNGSDPRSDEGDTPVYGSGKGHFKTCKEFKKGPTVLLGRKGTVNIPQWIEGNYWNVDTAFDVHAKGNYLLKLFFYAASCFDYDNYSTQTALPSMTQSNYLNFRIPFMNVEEQHKIADFLDQKCSEIDQTISEKQQQLDTLAEYKKSMIYEYVTGKKEVA